MLFRHAGVISDSKLSFEIGYIFCSTLLAFHTGAKEVTIVLKFTRVPERKQSIEAEFSLSYFLFHSATFPQRIPVFAVGEDQVTSTVEKTIRSQYPLIYNHRKSEISDWKVAAKKVHFISDRINSDAFRIFCIFIEGRQNTT